FGFRRGSLGGQWPTVATERFILAKNVGNEACGRVGRHRELVVQGSTDLGRRPAVLEKAPDQESARVQRIEALMHPVEKQALLADGVQAQVGKGRKARHAMRTPI